MTDTRIPAPTAPGRTGLPADSAPVTREPPSRPRVRGRVVLAGVIAALAIGTAGGALGPVVGSVLGPVEAAGPAGTGVATSTPQPAAPHVNHVSPAAADRNDEQD